MSEPDFLAQSAEITSESHRREWFRARTREYREQGATWARYCIHSDHPTWALVEAWKERPADEGEPRWQLSADQEQEP